jgi:hypothetical protein
MVVAASSFIVAHPLRAAIAALASRTDLICLSMFVTA